MGNWFELDFARLILQQASFLEMILRGTLGYLALFLLVRFVPKRQIGEIVPNDILIVVIIGNIAVAGMVWDAMAIVDVLVLLGTVLGWGFLLDWLGWRFPRLRSLLREERTILMRDGRLEKANMHREMVTEEELQAELRKQGIQDPGEAQDVSLEDDGRISVISRKREADGAPSEPARPTSDAKAPFLQGEADPAAQVDQAVHQFLLAARQLQERGMWHQQQIVEHEQGIQYIKQLLAEQGVRWKPGPRPSPCPGPKGHSRKGEPAESMDTAV